MYTRIDNARLVLIRQNFSNSVFRLLKDSRGRLFQFESGVSPDGGVFALVDDLERYAFSSAGGTGGGWTLLPRDKFRDHKPPAPTLRRTTGYHTEWLAACRGGPPTLCNFTDFAAPLTEVMLLGCLAQRVGKRIEWDPAAMKATNCPEAAAFIKRDYRKGWQI